MTITTRTNEPKIAESKMGRGAQPWRATTSLAEVGPPSSRNDGGSCRHDFHFDGRLWKLLLHYNLLRRLRGQPRQFGRRVFALSVVSGLLAASGGKAACGDLLIEGGPDAVHLEARNVPVRQLLDAMQLKFNLHYRTDDTLDLPVTGTFNGSLRQVALRLLNDYDFVMKTIPEGIDVLVMRRNQIYSESVTMPTGKGGQSPASVLTPHAPAKNEGD